MCCVLRFAKGFTVDCKSALLAENVQRERERMRRTEKTQWIAVERWMKNKQLFSMICFCEKGLWIYCVYWCFCKALVLYMWACVCFFSFTVLLKFGNVYGFHVLPPNEFCFFYNPRVFFLFFFLCLLHLFGYSMKIYNNSWKRFRRTTSHKTKQIMKWTNNLFHCFFSIAKKKEVLGCVVPEKNAR